MDETVCVNVSIRLKGLIEPKVEMFLPAAPIAPIDERANGMEDRLPGGLEAARSG